MAGVTALYLRVSVDDEKHDESDSIQNQRDLLNAYVTANPALSNGEVLTFFDDGWSGTNFERPQVKALLDLARRGEVQTILVKDLSRWGRNYPEVSEYLDQIFPFLGIRFISLGEGYDSENYKGQTAPMDIGFGTIMHDIYCKELSLKVRQSYFSKAKNGEFLCGSPPFGFVKSTTKRNKLEVDTEAAEIVQHIFTLACEGNSNTQIAVALNNDGVDTPLMYRKRKGYTLRGNHFVAGSKVFWTGETVRKILIDERYAGVMVTGKQRISSPGSRKVDYLPESEWIRIPNSHEAIVSEDVFKQANANIRHVKINSSTKKRALFSGKMKCGCCGKSLEYAATRISPYYYCESNRFGGDMGCFEGRLYLSDLSDMALATVKAETQKVLDVRQKYKQQLNGKKDKTNLLAEIKKLSSRKTALERKGISLFEEFADGNLNKDAYVTATTSNAEELNKIQVFIENLNGQLAVVESQNASQPSDEPILQRIISADSVTSEVLSLIERINVFDENRIEIRFAFRDANTKDKGGDGQYEHIRKFV